MSSSFWQRVFSSDSFVLQPELVNAQTAFRWLQSPMALGTRFMWMQETSWSLAEADAFTELACELASVFALFCNLGNGEVYGYEWMGRMWMGPFRLHFNPWLIGEALLRLNFIARTFYIATLRCSCIAYKDT